MKPVLTADGSHTLLSTQFDEHYHSRHGAIQESLHVFIDMGLQYLSSDDHTWYVLEYGFGTGLNALLTWITATEIGHHIHYTALEAYPLDTDTVRSLNHGTQLQHPSEFLQLHASPWSSTQALSQYFHLTKHQIHFESYRSDPRFHLIYYDAFAPNTQPRLWEADHLQYVFRALLPGGLLVTYCAKGSFRRALEQVGLCVERIPGPPGKREMIRARRP